jgi:shikimate kinase
MDMLDGRSLAVWLKVRPETAVARLRATLHSRPLLDVEEPIEAARGLLRARAAHYGRCGITIDTERRSPEQVVREILRQPILRREDKEESE